MRKNTFPIPWHRLSVLSWPFLPRAKLISLGSAGQQPGQGREEQIHEEEPMSAPCAGCFYDVGEEMKGRPPCVTQHWPGFLRGRCCLVMGRMRTSQDHASGKSHIPVSAWAGEETDSAVANTKVTGCSAGSVPCPCLWALQMSLFPL